mmetsp:Transcript_33228/g.44292  ORF Transcript_33228/g.44292 Transcript_33228/m.44292 type:complete len:116 (+) Transcript_33228:1496-1843(+)
MVQQREELHSCPKQTYGINVTTQKSGRDHLPQNVPCQLNHTLMIVRAAEGDLYLMVLLMEFPHESGMQGAMPEIKQKIENGGKDQHMACQSLGIRQWIKRRSNIATATPIHHTER